MLTSILDRVPAGWMSPLAREFVIAFVCYNIQELRKMQAMNKTLFLAWQDKEKTREWFPVGRLDVLEP